MKFLIIMSCMLALTQAAYPATFYHPQAGAAIGYNGAPIETPEVQIAKASHFAAHANARYGAPAPFVHYGVGNALPLDTPEVAAAKIQHYQDYAVAAQRNGVHVPHIPVATGIYPLDTPEVQVAKAAHFAAHAEANARSHGGHYRRRRAVYPLHYPVIDHNGVPVETPEVQAAKAHHFSEYAKVQSRPGQQIPDTSNYNSAYTYPQHVPTFGYNGVPLDTPEVQAAKSNHFSALAQASSHSGYYAPYSLRGPGGPPAQIGQDGQPIETHEVQAAKSAHFAAHAALRSGQYGHPGHY